MRDSFLYVRPCHLRVLELKLRLNCAAVPSVRAGRISGGLDTLNMIDPALRAPSCGRVRLRKHPTGMFSSLRMTREMKT